MTTGTTQNPIPVTGCNCVCHQQGRVPQTTSQSAPVQPQSAIPTKRPRTPRTPTARPQKRHYGCLGYFGAAIVGAMLTGIASIGLYSKGYFKEKTLPISCGTAVQVQQTLDSEREKFLIDNIKARTHYLELIANARNTWTKAISDGRLESREQIDIINEYNAAKKYSDNVLDRANQLGLETYFKDQLVMPDLDNNLYMVLRAKDSRVLEDQLKQQGCKVNVCPREY